MLTGAQRFTFERVGFQPRQAGPAGSVLVSGSRCYLPPYDRELLPSCTSPSPEDTPSRRSSASRAPPASGQGYDNTG